MAELKAAGRAAPAAEAVPEARRLAYLAGSVVGAAVMMGLAWGIVYAYALKPLIESWPARSSVLSSLDLGSTLWWRTFIAVAFDLLVLAIAVLGTLWIIGVFYLEAREAGKWRIYYSTAASRDVWLPRLTAWQRVQHLWMLTTFIIAAVTGFAAYSGVLAPRSTLLLIHAYNGILMGVLALLHFGYYTAQLLVAKARGEDLRKRFPMLEIYSRKFLRNLWRVIRGKPPEPMGKYDVEQLFEYWGVYWGMAVLGVPGAIMLLYGNQALGGILYTMHVKEAVLAVTFILMVHITYAHLRPKIFPWDPTFLTGKMPLKRALEEHPEWARQLLEEEQGETAGEREKQG